jgi:hypothetical protein
MNDQWQATECRLLDLLADLGTFVLTRSEEEELRQLTECVPGFDDGCMEEAAATVQLAFTSVEPMPAGLHTNIRAYGERYVAESTRDSPPSRRGR